MNFLIDTNICSAYLKGDQRVWNRFQQYMGGLSISVVTAGELWTWQARKNTSARSRQAVTLFLDSIDIHEVDLNVALRFGELRAGLLDSGKPMPDMDALIAATALHHNLTLVTHNVADFVAIDHLARCGLEFELVDDPVQENPSVCFRSALPYHP